MTRIETETIVPAPPLMVWRTLLEHDRWMQWAADDLSKVKLCQVEALDDEPESIGAQRRCIATLPRFPGFGQREVSWTERVSDLDRPWTIEYEAMAARALRRWRLRIVLVEQLDGQTRLRCRLSYQAPRPVAWLADRVFLRRSLSTTLRLAVAGLAKTFQPEDQPARDAEPDEDAVRLAAAQPERVPLPGAGDSSLAASVTAEAEVSGAGIDSKATPLAV